MEYYSSIKMNKLLIHVTTTMNLTNIMLNERRQKRKRTHRVSINVYELLEQAELIKGENHWNIHCL